MKLTSKTEEAIVKYLERFKDAKVVLDLGGRDIFEICNFDELEITELTGIKASQLSGNFMVDAYSADYKHCSVGTPLGSINLSNEEVPLLPIFSGKGWKKGNGKEHIVAPSVAWCQCHYLPAKGVKESYNGSIYAIDASGEIVKLDEVAFEINRILNCEEQKKYEEIQNLPQTLEKEISEIEAQIRRLEAQLKRKKADLDCVEDIIAAKVNDGLYETIITPSDIEEAEDIIDADMASSYPFEIEEDGIDRCGCFTVSKNEVIISVSSYSLEKEIRYHVTKINDTVSVVGKEIFDRNTHELITGFQSL